jgi:hypothetical protein
MRRSNLSPSTRHIRSVWRIGSACSNLEADLTILESDPYKTDPKIMAIKVGETWVAGEKKCG